MVANEFFVLDAIGRALLGAAGNPGRVRPAVVGQLQGKIGGEARAQGRLRLPEVGADGTRGSLQQFAGQVIDGALDGLQAVHSIREQVRVIQGLPQRHVGESGQHTEDGQGHQHLDERECALAIHVVGPPIMVVAHCWLATPGGTGAPTKPVTVRIT